MISAQIENFNAQIREICAKCSRNADDIVLVGATKYAQFEQIVEAIDAGLTHIAENRLQDAIQKFAMLGEKGNQVTKHMIGHLQTNKVKDAVQTFDLIQSVDSVKLVHEIEKQSKRIEKTTDILLQVNIADEEQKFGADEANIDEILDAVSNAKHIQLLGLMTMAPLTEDEGLIRGVFAQARKLSEQISKKFRECSNIEMKYLSMGMTNDFKIALEEGSNMIRIGRALFKRTT